jgi:hypothetical protein
MLNLLKIGLILWIIEGLFVQCNSSASTENGNSKNEEYNAVVEVAKNFCIALDYKDFKKLIELVDNSSKNRVIELKNSDVTYLNYINFIKVDTCQIDANEAVCTCVFEKEGKEIEDKFKLLRYKQGWLVNFDWGPNHINPFIVNTDLVFKEGFPPIKPTNMDSLEKVNFSNSLDIIYKIIHLPENVVGFLKMDVYKKDYDKNIYIRDSINNSIINGSVVIKDGWDVIFVYDNFTFSLNYFFENNTYLSKIELSYAVKNNNQFAFFQAISEALTSKYGKPFNALDINLDTYYQYEKLKWYIKGCNEELHLTHEEYFVKLIVVQAEHLNNF